MEDDFVDGKTVIVVFYSEGLVWSYVIEQNLTGAGAHSHSQAILKCQGSHCR